MNIKEKQLPDQQVPLRKTKEVFMTITIGNAQIGSSLLQFSDEETFFDKGKIKNVLIGKGADLIGRELQLMTNVLDTNNKSNKMPIKHLFHYADNSTVFLLDETDNVVEEDGDVFSLKINYQFVAHT